MVVRSPLRRKLMAAALAAGLLVAARFLWLDVYRVETASMEPFLYGSPTGGDRVLVLRRPRLSRSLARFGPVVFRAPDGAHAVKRVVGLPGETILLVEGEVLRNGEHYRKTPAELETMLVPVFDSLHTPWEDLWKGRAELWRREPDRSILLDAAPAGDEGARLVTRRSILDEYLGPDGSLVPGRVVVEDLAVAIEWEPLGEGGTLGVFLHRSAQRYEYYLHRDAAGTLATIRRASVAGEGVELARGMLPAIPAGRNVAVEAFDVDGRLRWVVDGVDAVAPVEVESPFPPAANGGTRSSGVTILGRGMRARIRRVLVRRDVHYVAEGRFGVDRPLVLGPDEAFLLGDNSAASLDGREWGPTPTSSLVGVPFLIYWPPGRIRLP
jgi:signal peptidase I